MKVYNDFENYSISILSSKYYKERASITCYHTANNQLKAVGLLYFYKDISDSNRDNAYDGATINLSYEMSSLSEITRLLRYEKPLRITFDTDTKTGAIETKSLEPTGEEE